MAKDLYAPAAREVGIKLKNPTRNTFIVGLALTAMSLLSSCMVVEEEYVRRNSIYENYNSVPSTTVIIPYTPLLSERCHWKRGWLGGWVEVCEPVGRGGFVPGYVPQEHHKWKEGQPHWNEEHHHRGDGKKPHRGEDQKVKPWNFKKYKHD